MSDWTVLHGDCFWWLRELPAASIDAVVTDPPYGIGFMGHEWDQPVVTGQRPAGHVSRTPRSLARVGRSRAVQAGSYDLAPAAPRSFQAWTAAWATEVLRVLKPGGHLVSFASTRTNHRHVCGIEDAGFEIRDSLCWLFGEGFPKSRNLDGDWKGWGSALKPGHEPITLARAPMAHRAMRDNVGAVGVGALNIDDCRISVADEDYARSHSGDRGHAGPRSIDQRGATDLRMGGGRAHDRGRWPANVVLDEEAAELLDEQSGQLVSGRLDRSRITAENQIYGAAPKTREGIYEQDAGGASRFYYCAKASRGERNAGMSHLPASALRKLSDDFGSLHGAPPAQVRNPHPTVKPIELMRWLVRLVTPPGGTVLDPFTGSGTTGCAAVLEDFDFVGIEREAEYADIAEARIRWWAEQPDGIDVDDALEAAARRRKVADTGQGSLLDMLG